jgi:hypothetical protein
MQLLDHEPQWYRRIGEQKNTSGRFEFVELLDCRSPEEPAEVMETSTVRDAPIGFDDGFRVCK